jgi:hypothetical protein
LHYTSSASQIIAQNKLIKLNINSYVAKEKMKYTFNCFPGGLEAKANALPELVASLSWLLTLNFFELKLTERNISK